jgi:hypothetical protein
MKIPGKGKICMRFGMGAMRSRISPRANAVRDTALSVVDSITENCEDLTDILAARILARCA